MEKRQERNIWRREKRIIREEIKRKKGKKRRRN